MDSPSRKLQHQTRQESAQEQQTVSGQEQTAQLFEQVEDLLRHDAGQTPLPPKIEERLRESAAQIAPPGKRWWNRWLGR